MIIINETLLEDTIYSLGWMLRDIDYRNKAVEKAEDSKEVLKAKACLSSLKALKDIKEKTYVQNG